MIAAAGLTRAQSARSLAEHAWTTAAVESRPEVAAALAARDRAESLAEDRAALARGAYPIDADDEWASQQWEDRQARAFGEAS